MCVCVCVLPCIGILDAVTTRDARAGGGGGGGGGDDDDDFTQTAVHRHSGRGDGDEARGGGGDDDDDDDFTQTAVHRHSGRGDGDEERAVLQDQWLLQQVLWLGRGGRRPLRQVGHAHGNCQ